MNEPLEKCPDCGMVKHTRASCSTCKALNERDTVSREQEKKQ